MTPAELADLQHEVMRQLAFPGAPFIEVVIWAVIAAVLASGLLRATLFARRRKG